MGTILFLASTTIHKSRDPLKGVVVGSREI
jgi:hypothetical protein